MCVFPCVTVLVCVSGPCLWFSSPLNGNPVQVSVRPLRLNWKHLPTPDCRRDHNINPPHDDNLLGRLSANYRPAEKLSMKRMPETKW